MKLQAATIHSQIIPFRVGDMEDRQLMANIQR
jgi:hypothetical protein